MADFFKKPLVKVLMLKGEAGSSIKGIEKTGTNGLEDTYTVNLSDGNSYTFNVTNGKGISSIVKTGTSGLTDTYTITYNDGTTSTFTVTNGEGIQNLQIGGVNLITGTRDFSGYWTNKERWTEADEKYNGLTVFKNNGAWGGIFKTCSVKSGETYTFSAYVKKLNDSYEGNTYFVLSDSGDYISPQSALVYTDSKWKQLSLTFTASADVDINPRVEYNTDIGGAIAVCGYKLERHRTPTDWTPAPEDIIDTSITNSDIDTILNS